MFEIVKAAGIKTSELARLLNISRVTASLWLNGHCSPHHLHADRVQRFLDCTQKAVENRLLPLPDVLHGEERRLRLLQVLRTTGWQPE